MAAGMIYTGTVTGVDEITGLPLVNVPALATRASFGPLETLAPGLAVGERVAVTNLGSSANSLMVLGRTGGRWPVIGEIPGLTGQLSALAAANAAEELRLTAVEALNATQDGRLTAVEGKNTTQDGRLTSVEARASALETRATSIEGVNGTQDTRLGTVEGRATALETRATAVESKNTTQDTAITAAQTAATNAQTAATAASAAVTTLRADTAGKATAKGQFLIATASGVVGAHAVVADGLGLIADSTATDGWSAKDILGMPKGLTGAVAATRYVGGTAGGAPTTGAFLVGDFVVDRNTGETWVCTVAGSPGTWVSSLAALRTALFGGPTRTAKPVCTLAMSGTTNRVLAASTDTYQDTQWSVVTDPESLFHSGAQPTNGFIQVPVAGRYDVEHLSLMGGVAGAFCIARIVLNTIATGSFVATDIRQVVSGLSEPFVVRARLVDRVLAASDKLYFAVWSSGASSVYPNSFGVKTGVVLRWVGVG